MWLCPALPAVTRPRHSLPHSRDRTRLGEGKKVVGGVILSRLEETGLSYNDFVAMARRLGADALKAEVRASSRVQPGVSDRRLATQLPSIPLPLSLPCG